MSFLESIDAERICTQPFPHLVVEDWLDEHLCTTLSREFPPMAMFVNGQSYASNSKLHIRYGTALRDSRVSNRWKEFLRAQVTQATFDQLLRLFADHIRRAYPDFEQRFGKLSELRAGIRNQDDYTNHDVLLDAQLSLHTPVTGEPSWDRGPHVKLCDKIVVGHLFLRPDDDPALGADWELYSIRPGAVPRFGPDQVTDLKNLRLEKTIPYRRNTLVLFLNTPQSIQGWSVRTQSNVPFMYFNCIAQMPGPLFELPAAPRLEPSSRWQRLAGRGLHLLAGHRP